MTRVSHFQNQRTGNDHHFVEPLLGIRLESGRRLDYSKSEGPRSRQAAIPRR